MMHTLHQNAYLHLHICMNRELLSVLQGEVDELRPGVCGLVERLKNDHTAGLLAVAGLMEVDKVKRNMEAACNTLKVGPVACVHNVWTWDCHAWQ